MSDDEVQTYHVTGMSCEHCVATVQRKLGELPGVRGVEVDLPSGEVQLSGDGLAVDVVRDAVEAAGYGLSDKA